MSCACGCGTVTPILQEQSAKYGTPAGKPRRYAPGHDKRFWRRGSPIVMQVTEAAKERFLSFTTIYPGPLDTPCRVWVGYRGPEGYGRYHIKGKTVSAHRVAYTLWYGPIPPHTTVDHLCRIRSCVNPGHLRLATNRENLIAGNGCSGKNHKKTHCLRGHPFNERNTNWNWSKWGTWTRDCRACRRLRRQPKKHTRVRR
jgi:hypothetical protein